MRNCIYPQINDGDLEYAVVLLEKATFHHSKNSDATVLLMAELEQDIRGKNITTTFTEVTCVAHSVS